MAPPYSDKQTDPCLPDILQDTHDAYDASLPVDPWAHRSAGMRCRTCMWFAVKGTGDDRGAIGRCRRRAPTMDGYPVVFETDWCGDHKLDETKT